MRKLFLFLILSIISSCTCNKASNITIINSSDITDSIKDKFSFIKSEILRDSLDLFIKPDNVFPNRQGQTVYTIQMAKYKQDTLIQFSSWNYTPIEDLMFDDPRFILETHRNERLLRDIPWDVLYDYVIEKSKQGFTSYGAIELNDTTVLAVVMRDSLKIDNLIQYNQFDSILFKKYEYTILDDQLGPNFKLYKYSRQQGLKLLIERKW